MKTLLAIASIAAACLTACADDGTTDTDTDLADTDEAAAVDQQVQDGLKLVKDIVGSQNAGALADLGLPDAAALDRLRPGRPLRAFLLGADALERWTPAMDVASLVEPLGELFVPVRVEGASRAAFLVRLGRVGGAWRVLGFGLGDYAEGVGDAELSSAGEAIVILQRQSNAAMALHDQRLVYLSSQPWQWDDEVTRGTVMNAQHIEAMRDAARAYRDAAGAAVEE